MRETRPLGEVVQHDLPPLRQQVARYLKEVNWEEWEKNEVAIVESAVHKNLVQTAHRMKKHSNLYSAEIQIV